jgi:hypothetical protein
MAAQQILHLREIYGLGAGFRERHVDVAVQDDNEPHLAGEVEHPVERGVGQAGSVARHL